MSGKRITMRKIRDILRLRHEGGLSIRQITASTKVSIGAIQKLLTRAKTLGLGWPLDAELTDTQLAGLFYPRADTRVSRRFEVPDWPVMHQELKRKGMTKQLLWEEYTEQYPTLLQLLAVLRPLPSLAGPAEALHASTPQSR